MKRNATRELTKTEQRGIRSALVQERPLDGFFEISKVVESPEMLQSWVDWFGRLNIPCVITRTNAGYTLWREGVEVG